jgi:hypothetical protein
MAKGFRLVSQITDIVFRVLKALESLIKGLPRDSEMLSSNGGILLSRGIVDDHPFHYQSFLGLKAQKICLSPGFHIYADLSGQWVFSDEIGVEAGWLYHSGNPPR